MSLREKHSFVSEADYLRLEESAEIKHEYVAGVIYAMSGAKNRHNMIASNCIGHLLARLRGSGCRPFNSDTKVRIQNRSDTKYYYPDTMVVCERNSDDDVFQDKPTLIIEVLSESTRRIDLSEKKDAYFSIPSLETYLVVEQDEPKVIVYRKSADGFEQVEIEGIDQTIDLPHLKTDLPLKEIYEDIEFDQ